MAGLKGTVTYHSLALSGYLITRMIEQCPFSLCQNLRHENQDIRIQTEPEIEMHEREALPSENRRENGNE